MNEVLVTGASGFIGRQCLPLLVAKGYDVHALCLRPEPGSTPGVSWHRCNLLHPGCATALMRQLRPQSLLHLAWYAVPGKFWEARENLEWLRASLELLVSFADHGGKRFVAAGTCAEYEWDKHDGKNENAGKNKIEGNWGECHEGTTSLLPSTLYGTSKHALQQIVHFSGWQTGLSSAWGRIFFLYGPHEHPVRLVAYAVQSLLRGEPAFCSEGCQVRDFLHVTDAAAAFVSLLQSEVEGPVNIASGKPTSIRKVLEEIGEQTGRTELLHFGARPSGAEASRIWGNVRRLKEEVGFSPQYDLVAGIRQTIEWWRHSLSSEERNSEQLNPEQRNRGESNQERRPTAGVAEP
ncbi:MAG: NAD(P)-dependent oxidoreductase [Candidatus Sulfotelmatobacter sp.]